MTEVNSYRVRLVTHQYTMTFQPTMLGQIVHFQDEGSGMITDENETEIYIESRFFTGWMSKAEFWESLGVED